MKTEEKTSHQLKFGDITFPPQVRTHMRTNSRQTIISIHHHVHKAITCCPKVRWQDEYQKKNKSVTMKNVNANKQMSKKKTGRCKKKTNKWQYSHTPPEKIKKKRKTKSR